MPSITEVDNIHEKPTDAGVTIGHDLKLSSGNAIKQADGTSLLTEAGALGSGIVFPAGHVIGVAYLFDERTYDANGDSSTTSYSVRAINAENDPYGIVASLASNEFTLNAGYYLIQWTANTYGCGDAHTKLHYTPSGGSETVANYGMSGYGDYAGNGGFGQCTGSYFTTLTVSTSFGIQQISENAVSNGHGRRSALMTSSEGIAGAKEIFMIVTIWKLVAP